MAGKAIVVNRRMAFRELTGAQEYVRVCYGKNSKNNCCSDKNKKWFQKVTSSSIIIIWKEYGLNLMLLK